MNVMTENRGHSGKAKKATTGQARKLEKCTFLSEIDKCHVFHVTRTHSKGEKEDRNTDELKPLTSMHT